MSATKPKFIVLLGGEGSGKSTQVKRLQERFSREQLIVSREPGGTPFAEELRDILFKGAHGRHASPETTFSLMWAARHDHMQKMIIPALEQGLHVVSDRFDCCSYAYQVHAQESPHLEDYFWITRELYLGKNTPDLYIFLDVSPEVGLRRVAGRKGGEAPNHFDEQQIAFHERIRNGYNSFLKKVTHIRIPADNDLASVSRDFDNAIAAIL